MHGRLCPGSSLHSPQPLQFRHLPDGKHLSSPSAADGEQLGGTASTSTGLPPMAVIVPLARADEIPARELHPSVAPLPRDLPPLPPPSDQRGTIALGLQRLVVLTPMLTVVVDY